MSTNINICLTRGKK